jgi:hypothetical protein
VGVYKLRDGSTHGFVLRNGIYSSVDYPRATATQAWGINDNGEIVGQWTDTANVNHGFHAVKH